MMLLLLGSGSRRVEDVIDLVHAWLLIVVIIQIPIVVLRHDVDWLSRGLLVVVPVR